MVKLEKTLLGFLIGVVVASLVCLYGLYIVSENIVLLISIFSIMVLLLGSVSLFVVKNKERVIQSVTGVTNDDAKILAEISIDLVASIRKGDVKSAKIELESILRQITHTYMKISFKRWIVTVFSVIFIGFASLMGAALLFSQNKLIDTQNRSIVQQTKLLSKQNSRIDQQTYLADASLRKPEASEVLDVENVIDEELRVTSTQKTIVRDEFINILQSKLLNFHPYYYLNAVTDSLLEDPYSPEKSRIFLKLLFEFSSNKKSWTKIKSNVAFNRIHLPSVIFPEPMDLSYGYFNGCNFYNSTFQKSNFVETKLNNTTFDECTIEGCRFERVFCPNSSFYNSDLLDVHFRKGTLNQADFENSTLTDVVFDSVDLASASFIDCTFIGTTFVGSYLYNAKFDQHDLNRLKRHGLTAQQIKDIDWVAQEKVENER